MLSYINKVKIIKNNFYYYFLNNKNKNFIYNYIIILHFIIDIRFYPFIQQILLFAYF